VHVRWAPDSTGLLEVWKDGTKVINRPGAPIGFNDVNGPTSKFGIYRSAPHSFAPYQNRVSYVNEYRVGGATASYETVAPRMV
jgi:hypothetical protein